MALRNWNGINSDLMSLPGPNSDFQGKWNATLAHIDLNCSVTGCCVYNEGMPWPSLPLIGLPWYYHPNDCQSHFSCLNQTATPKITVPETDDPHRPWRWRIVLCTATHRHCLACANTGINKTAIILFYRNPRKNITRIQVICVYKQQHRVNVQYLTNKHAGDVCVSLYKEQQTPTLLLPCS